MGFTGFMKKEIREILKTPKLFILPSLFLIFGFLSPLTARYINELLKSFGGAELAGLQLKEPTYLDAYGQLYKNLGQMGFIIMVLTLAGTVVSEKAKGTAVLALTKGVSRSTFILCKFLANALLFTGAYLLSCIGCIYYTYLLFPQWTNASLLPALASFWLYGLFLLALAILVSTLARSQIAAGVGAFVGYLAFSLISSLPTIGKYTPGVLGSIGLELLGGTKSAGEALLPVCIASIILLTMLLLSMTIFRRQEL